MNEVLIGFVVAFLVWMATDWPFTYVLLGVGLAWLLLFRNGGSMGSGVGSWITSTVKGIFGTTLRLTVGVVIFIGLMMLVNKLASNSPYWISRRFQTLGWDVWNWPANIGLPLLFFVCTTILAGWVAKRAATGDAQIAGWIFGISAVVIFTMWWFPRTTEVVRPKPVGKTGPLKPGETQAWADADQAVAESGGGPTAFCIGWKAVLGPRWPCSDTTIMGAVRGMLPPSPAGSRTYTPAPAPTAPIAARVLTPTLHPFGSADCVTRNLGYSFRVYPKGGSVRVRRPDGTEYIDSPGVDVPLSRLGPGEWKFCKEDASATGVEIWE